MSLAITTIENTATIPAENALAAAKKMVRQDHAEVFGLDPEYLQGMSNAVIIAAVFHTVRETERLGLAFNSDHMEHVDWLTDNAEACAALAAAGATGRVLFGSLDGDISGSFWGVEFASGHYRPLTGSLVWTPGTSVAGV